MILTDSQGRQYRLVEGFAKQPVQSDSGKKLADGFYFWRFTQKVVQSTPRGTLVKYSKVVGDYDELKKELSRVTSILGESGLHVTFESTPQGLPRPYGKVRQTNQHGFAWVSVTAETHYTSPRQLSGEIKLWVEVEEQRGL